MTISKTKSVIEAYDAIAHEYACYADTKKNYLESIDSMVDEYIKDGMRILDVGAGDGRRAAKIIDKYELDDYVAIEPSKNMANICRNNTGCIVYESFAEELHNLEIGKFDLVLSMWNVFGHIFPTISRLNAMKNITKKLKPDGVVLIDVNNRYNASSYGYLNVFRRIIFDKFQFDEKNGDSEFNWTINDKNYRGNGHLFTPKEFEDLVKKANMEVIVRRSVNYKNGGVSELFFKGQLFYKLGMR